MNRNDYIRIKKIGTYILYVLPKMSIIYHKNYPIYYRLDFYWHLKTPNNIYKYVIQVGRYILYIFTRS